MHRLARQSAAARLESCASSAASLGSTSHPMRSHGCVPPDIRPPASACSNVSKTAGSRLLSYICRCQVALRIALHRQPRSVPASRSRQTTPNHGAMPWQAANSLTQDRRQLKCHAGYRARAVQRPWSDMTAQSLVFAAHQHEPCAAEARRRTSPSSTPLCWTVSPSVNQTPVVVAVGRRIAGFLLSPGPIPE
ncbi:hypothetical protein BDV95DRAFT_183122 [Massariosphaeria phaeospora]|uniref:Uncharacterized protein n=1 Tax=Massariosphaeria phaeospora TaxID=100035 RepID=A0A7C8I087_9PLEO|nr:hypothetical protein BDV95DRAFT_183122 [Massariosphaeria phaeospora]